MKGKRNVEKNIKLKKEGILFIRAKKSFFKKMR